MLARLALLASAFLAAGCGNPVVVEIAATYAGADAVVVAETVDAPIEQQVNGVEKMTRIASTSRSDGTYTARVTFAPGINPKIALVLVQNRVNMANPQLPNAVRRSGVTVMIGAADPDEKDVTVALLDKGNDGRKGYNELCEWAEVVMKRIAADREAVKPDVLPGPGEPGFKVHIDREKCEAAGVKVADVLAAVEKAGRKATADALGELAAPSTGGTVRLKDVAKFEATTFPTAVYRLNMKPAVRLTALVPEGKTAADVAAKWADLAKPPEGYAVEIVSGK